MWVSFASWLKLVPSGSLEVLLNTLVCFFVAKKAGAQRFMVDARASNRHFLRMRIPSWLQAILALPAVLASEVGYTGKSIERKRPVPDSLIYPVPATLPMGFSWAVFFCQDVTDHCTLAESADSLLLFYRDHSTPPLLGSKHGLGSHGFRWSSRERVSMFTT